MTRKFKRPRGYLTFAQNSPTTDYVRLAYGLALSLKATQADHAHLSIVVTPGTRIPERYMRVFDEVIDIPWVDEAKDEAWKLQNEWKAYHVTPYEETIKLDADMLFCSDITEWWDAMARQDFCSTTTAMTYRGEVVTSDYYRKTFTANALPNVYSGLTYFRYSETSQKIFEMMETIFHNWEKFSYEYLDDTRPEHASTDVVLAMAIKLLDMENDCTPLPCMRYPRFTHMKSGVQNWPEGSASDNWMEHLDAVLTPDLQIRIGRHRQTAPLHYQFKQFLTDEMINTYEEHLNL